MTEKTVSTRMPGYLIKKLDYAWKRLGFKDRSQFICNTVEEKIGDPEDLIRHKVKEANREFQYWKKLLDEISAEKKILSDDAKARNQATRNKSSNYLENSINF